MLLKLTRSTGDPVVVNIQQVLSFYPLGNGQTYLVFSADRFNLTVEESFDVICDLLADHLLPHEKGLRSIK